jgi:hypothetical protein
MQVRSQEGAADVAAQKQRLETQLANERIMFEFGDLSKEEYIERRGELIRRPDGLRETDESEADLAGRGLPERSAGRLARYRWCPAQRVGRDVVCVESDQRRLGCGG